MVEHNETDSALTIRLTPNRSASWYESKLMIGVIVLTAVIIAIGWLSVGVWMILPFAGIEVGLFSVLMYVVCRQTYRQQQVIVHPDKVEFTDQVGNKRQAKSMSREHFHIEVEETERDWELPQIYLVTPVYRFQVGHFLNLEDRHNLRTVFRNYGLPVCRTHWWKSH